MKTGRCEKHENVTVYKGDKVWLTRYPDRFIMDYDEFHYIVFPRIQVCTENNYVYANITNAVLDSGSQELLMMLIDLHNRKSLSPLEVYFHIISYQQIRELYLRYYRKEVVDHRCIQNGTEYQRYTPIHLEIIER